MSLIINEKKLLGINGLGRIGKLTLWYHLIQRKFDGIVVNIGREVGKSLDDLVQIILNDSTYGRLDHFLYGHSGKKCQVEIPDYESQIVFIDGFPIKILNKERSPQNINWRNEKVRIVVDCTGKFLDPTISPAEGKDALCGHLTAGAQKVISSAPFKIKNASTHDLDSFPTLIYGINHTSYDPLRHHIISAASCTATARCWGLPT